MLELDQIARLHAALQDGAHWDELLRKERITRAQWLAAERTWLDAMVAEAAAGRFELCDRYMQALLGGPAASVQLAKPPEPRLVMETPLPPVQAANALVPARVLPPLPPAPIVIKTMQPPVVGTVDIGEVLSAHAKPREAFPFDPKAASTLSAAKENESRHAPKERVVVSGTLDIDEIRAAAAPKAAPVPFKNPTKASPAKPLSETMDIGELLASGAKPAMAIPFDPSASPKPAVVLQKEKPAPKAADEVGGTLDISAILLAGNPTAGATPFEKPKQDKPTSVSSQLAATTALPSLAPISKTPALTLERYASLCVEYAAAPTRAAEIAQRYGLTREQWVSADAYWRAKMASDPAVRAAWEKACVTYREWLSRR